MTRPTLLAEPRRGLPGRRPGEHDLLALDRGARKRSGNATDRMFGLHVFNPVPKMELVELCLPDELRAGVAEPRDRLVRGDGEDAR